MSMEQLMNIQQQLFFEFGHKVDVYHFERIQEIVVMKHGEILTPNSKPLQVFNY